MRTAAAADGVDDVNIARQEYLAHDDPEFDEVELGDGDSSHQINSHTSGIIITWHTCEDDTFKVFREDLCDMF